MRERESICSIDIPIDFRIDPKNRFVNWQLIFNKLLDPKVEPGVSHGVASNLLMAD